MNPPFKYIDSQLRYEPDTGFIFWKERKMGRQINKQAGWLDPREYRQIMLDGRVFYGHRIAWLLATGSWPKEDIDHIDGNHLDNRLVNLREASHIENMRNSKRQKNNTSGIPGVDFSQKRKKPWRVRIKVNGEEKHVGLFSNKKEALAARAREERKYFGEFIRPNRTEL